MKRRASITKNFIVLSLSSITARRINDFAGKSIPKLECLPRKWKDIGLQAIGKQLPGTTSSFNDSIAHLWIR